DLAGRYRSLVNDPERGAIAKKRIDTIFVLAMQMLESTKSPSRAKESRAIGTAIGLVVALVLTYLFFSSLRR
ncbi:hypothetical protein ACO1K4_14355, partial [Staphylococcus aureus]